MRDTKEAAKAYNQVAEIYHKKRIIGNDFNELLDQSATFRLLGNVKGKKVLDAGCGSGIYTKILVKKRAKVKAMELSKEMLILAKEYCKDCNVEFKQGSIDNLPYKNNSFDIVVASLVIHYLRTPKTAFKEFSRVLKKGGILVFSTHHPVFQCFEEVRKKGKKKLIIISDYFHRGIYYWTLYNSKVKIPSYKLDLEKLFDILYNNNFIVEKFVEPFLSKKLKKELRGTHREKFIEVPSFIVLKCRKLK